MLYGNFLYLNQYNRYGGKKVSKYWKSRIIYQRITEELYDIIMQHHMTGQEIFINAMKLFFKQERDFSKEEIEHFYDSTYRKRVKQIAANVNNEPELQKKYKGLDIGKRALIVDTAIKDYLKFIEKDEKYGDVVEDDEYINIDEETVPFESEEERKIGAEPEIELIGPELDNPEEEFIDFDPYEINLQDLIIYICDYCNLECEHCYLSKGKTTVNPRWIQWLVDNFNIKKSIIVGGEPTICKKLIDLHNESIWFVTKPGHGSTFCFSLAKFSPKKAKNFK